MFRSIGHRGKVAQLESVTGLHHSQFPSLYTFSLALAFKKPFDYGGYIRRNVSCMESVKNVFPFQFISASAGLCVGFCHGLVSLPLEE